MKSVMKKFAFVALVVLFALAMTGCPHDVPGYNPSEHNVVGATFSTEWYEFPVDAETGDVASEKSTYVYFGVFPKTVLPLDSTVTVDETQSKTMGANTYYKGSDGNWYAKVRENAHYTFQVVLEYTDGTQPRLNEPENYRYFKVEPIKWRVLTKDYYESGNALLFAEDILTSNVPFCEEDEGCSYKYSTVRAYLNGTYESGDTQPKTYADKGFFQTAFTETAQALIPTTELDIRRDLTGWDHYGEQFVTESISDKIFLLSENEVHKGSYGFPPEHGSDKARIRVATDYAKANGCYDFDSAYAGGWWWVRLTDPNQGNGISMPIIFASGDQGGLTPSAPYSGIVPALTIALPSTSQHIFAPVWTNDENYHWHAATCVHTSVVGDKALHTWDAGVVTKEPTEQAEGAKKLTCTVCGRTKIEPIAKLAGDSFNWYESPVDTVTGLPATSESEYVYFGVFPKSVLSLNSKVTVDEKVSVTMGANDYYRGSDGNWYAKVRENANGEGVEYTYTDGSQAKKNGENSYRYFKVEPIKWRVLSDNYNGSSNALLLAENVLSANVPYYRYNAAKNTRTAGSDTDIYPSNYKYSQIRAYLNGLDYYYDKSESSTVSKTDYSGKGFLQTAFTQSAREKIVVTNVDNSGASTTDEAGIIPKADGKDGKFLDYTCAGTKDKIFLLSEKEVSTAAYGFDAYDSMGENNARIRATTDYAKANYAYQSSGAGYGGNWWLRSPFYEDGCFARCVSADGFAGSCIAYDGKSGIVPALTISLQ